MDIKTTKKGLFLFSFIVLGIISGVVALTHEISNPQTTQGKSNEESIILKGVTICFQCHDAAQTIGFHYPDKIIKIEELKGLRRRICVDCHGASGTDPDRQMTESSKITWVEDKNYFRIKEDVVHGIHLKKLESEVMVCETCHLIKDGDPTKLGSDLVIPIPNPGQIIVCQMCHVPSNPGNYISLHIISGHQECNTCHTGDLKAVHQRATGKLGQTS